jgi:hypothetical protein
VVRVFSVQPAVSRTMASSGLIQMAFFISILSPMSGQRRMLKRQHGSCVP